MEGEYVFVDMPVEEDEACQSGGDAYGQVFFKVECFEVPPLLKEVAQEEETKATYQAVISNIGGIVIVFVGTIE